jgi:hypothetical protein
MDDIHGKILGKLWAAEAAGYIGKLKERSMYPAHLQVPINFWSIVIASRHSSVCSFVPLPEHGPQVEHFNGHRVADKGCGANGNI